MTLDHPQWKVFSELVHECPWCDGICARDPGEHPCTQCDQTHYFEDDEVTEYQNDMTINDWAAAKTIWQAIKESELDLSDEVVVHVGIRRPSGELEVMVEAVDEYDPYLNESLSDQISELQAQIAELLSRTTE